jgi:hypothetical protein
LCLLGEAQVVDDDPVDEAVGVCGVDPAVRSVGIPGGQVGEGAAFPRLDLAAVVRQLAGVGVAGQGGKQATGADLGELRGVPD